MREIVFDTETTGRSPFTRTQNGAILGDRVVELGAVELFNLVPTGRTLHLYFCPQCDVPEEVVRIHGLTKHFLQDKPLFGTVVQEVLDFFGDAPLIAHNAEFDRAFVNAEFRDLKTPELPSERFVDTLAIARKRYPGASCSLDALAKRFQLDRFGFDLGARKGAGGHGALLDAKILAEVYLQLKGGREQRLDFALAQPQQAESGETRTVSYVRRDPRPQPLPALANDAEAAAHAAFIETLGEKALWRKFGS
jgi:DNA polymerase III subunit epsilon